jgi:CoA:oxalate CoA-transferase
MKTKTYAEWQQEFDQLGIPCGPVNRVDQVAEDPQIKARDMIKEIESPRYGKFRVVNTPFKFSRTPSGPQGFAPELGADTEAVLNELLGMTPAEVEKLKQDKIL